MLWYLLKTWTGREEELVRDIRRTVPSHMYNEAFVIYTERVWRRQGRSIVHQEPLFKRCVFLTCPETGSLSCRTEWASVISGLMAYGCSSVLPLRWEDVRFLERISGADHVLRLSYLLREGDGPFYRVSGPLESCLSDISGIEFRKRFAKVHRNLWGEEQDLAMCLILNEDMEQGIIEDDLEVPVERPGHYSLLEMRWAEDGKRFYVPVQRQFPENIRLHPAQEAAPVEEEEFADMTKVG